MSLKQQAMLVTLSVSCWTNAAKDKKISAEIERTHSAKDAGRYIKTLVDKHHIDPLKSYGDAIRAYHYSMTLPWKDGGDRLLPSRLYLEYTAEVRKRTREYADMVDKFIALYDSTLVQAARQRLGTMYDPDDYPTGSELRSKFGVELDFNALADGHDFRVDVGDAERERIASGITAKMAERQAAAQRSAWVRLRETLDLAQVRLSQPKALFRDTLISNIEDLVRILPGLNIANDPLMDSVCKQVTEKLIVDPARLRRSETLRRQVATDASLLIQQIPV